MALASRVARRFVLVMAVASVGLGWGRWAIAQARPAEADPILAERLVDLASETLSGAELSTAQYREAGVLLQGASRLNPGEARYHRLRYEALSQAGDMEGAKDALVAYARLEPSDAQAQLKIIELYANQMETADAKLKYLMQDLLGTPTIVTELRSHAAVLACRVMLDRGEAAAAASLATEAARLDPYNATAQRLKYELVLSKGTPLDRLNGLLAIVRAAPLDMGAISAVADELSMAGVDESSQWYDGALGLAIRNGQRAPRELVINYAARLFVSGQVRDAAGLVNQIVTADPEDVNAQVLQLAIDRAESDASRMAGVMARRGVARTVLTNRLMMIAHDAGEAGATTRPITGATTEPVAIPDAKAMAEKVLAKNDPELKDAFVAATADLAWVDIFFMGDPASLAQAKGLIEGLRLVVPGDSPLLARLEGWVYLVEKKDDEAGLKLSAVEKVDPLAALGMMRLEKEPQLAEQKARALRSGFSHGVTGAILASELLPRKTPLVLSTGADAMRAAAESFPKQLLRLIDSPQTFYFMRAEPLATTVGYGEPMLVRVTVVNTSELDLPLGGVGALRSDLWFDVAVRGMNPAAFPATAYDRLGGPAVLHPKGTASRIVRLDQKKLLAYLRTNPNTSVPISGTVITNPASFGDRVASGAGGYAVSFNRLMEQLPVPVSRPEQRKALLDGLSTAPGAKRVGLIDAAVFYAKGQVPGSAQEAAEFQASLRAAVDGLASDPDLTAKSWGTFWGLLSSEGPARVAKAKAASKDAYWLTRLLAIAGMRGGDATAYRALVTEMSNDADPLVAQFAKAALDELDDAAPPTSQPATMP